MARRWIAILLTIMSAKYASSQEHSDDIAIFAAQSGAAVHSSENLSSAIIYDLAPGTLVKARPRGSDWLEISAFGASQALKVRQKSIADETLPILIHGFVKAGAVDIFPLQPPFPPDDLRKVPQYWASMGISDSRFFVKNPDLPPFNAIVQVSFIHDSDQEGLCTGTIVSDRQTVVTSGHCIPNGYKNLKVRIIRGSNRVEEISAKLVAKRENIIFGSDWAVVRLDTSPISKLEPLVFHNGDQLKYRRRMSLLIPGYPSDLELGSIAEVGYQAISATNCEADLSDAKQPYPSGLLVKVIACPVGYGNSGSPYLLLNRSTGRYEIVAIHSGVDFEAEGDLSHNDLTFARKARDIAIANLKLVAREDNKAVTDRWFTPRMIRADYGGILGYYALRAGISTFIERQGSYDAQLVTKVAESTGLQNLAGPVFPTIDATLLPGWQQGSALEQDPPSLQGSEERATPHDNEEYSSSYVSSRVLWYKIRRICTKGCETISLDRAVQIMSSYGTAINLELLKTKGFRFQTATYSKLGADMRADLDRRFGSSISSQLILLFAGGDAFFLMSDSGLPVWILRDVMQMYHRQPLGPLAWHHPECGSARTFKDDGEMWGDEPEGLSAEFNRVAPHRITGGETVSAREAECLIERPNNPALVVSALDEPWGVPGAVGMGWAASAGTLHDRLQEKLAAIMQVRANSDFTKPIIVYCHSYTCMMSYNIALRLIRIGYTSVYWMRDGIEGWTRDGFKLGKVELLASPLESGDVGNLEKVPQPIGWHEFVARTGNTRVELPGPVQRVFYAPNFGETPFTSEIITATDGLTSYSVTLYDLASLKSHPAIRDQTVAEYEKGREITVMGQSGREIVDLADGKRKVSHLFITDSIMIEQSIVINKDIASKYNSDISRFFDFLLIHH